MVSKYWCDVTRPEDWIKKCQGCHENYHNYGQCHCLNASYAGCLAWWFDGDISTIGFTKQYHTDSVIDVMRAVGRNLNHRVYSQDAPYFAVKAVKTNDIRRGLLMARRFIFKYDYYFYSVPGRYLPTRIEDDRKRNIGQWGMPINFRDVGVPCEHFTQYVLDPSANQDIDEDTLGYIEKSLVSHLEKNGGKLV